MAGIFYTLLAIAALIGLDQVLKIWLAGLLVNGSIDIIPNVLSLTYHENFGAAFGILQERRWFLIIITMVVMIIIYLAWATKRVQGKTATAAVILIVGGGIGNLVDRIFRGYVIDYIYFEPINFPIFNFADSCVVVGAGLLIIYLLLIEPKLHTASEPQPPEKAPPAAQ